MTDTNAAPEMTLVTGISLCAGSMLSHVNVLVDLYNETKSETLQRAAHAACANKTVGYLHLKQGPD
jgi:hypothetical protein